jgi:2-polyprenyl-3-methyl-5-hydroxy-6-metoxy-1,4-benzoquinol methylase
MLPSVEEQRGFWDWHWSHRAERGTVNAWKDRRHEAIVAYLASLRLERPRILDVGCGTGVYTKALARFGPTTGLDLSPAAIDVARSELPGIEFLAGNMYDYPFRDAYDVIVAQEVFDHVQDQATFVERAAGLLGAGGYLILSCTNRFVLERARDLFPPQPAHHIFKPLLRRELRALLRPRFRVLRTTSVVPLGNHGILRVLNSPRLNAILRAVVGGRGLERLKERCGLGFQNIVLAQKQDTGDAPKRTP